MAQDDRIGRIIADRYQIDRVIGRGGMGMVYGGSHTWTERPVAVKLLHADLADDPTLLKRFFREAKATAKLRHPNVVEILDMGEDEDGSAFIVLELLEGRSLGALLAEEKRLEPPRAYAILYPVMDALAAAHEMGIVHRDVKPENVFLAAGFRGGLVPKLLDFGIAKVLEGTMMTAAGTTLGTPTYMAPEQAISEGPVGASADIWSIGAVWFHVLAGRPPVDGLVSPTATMFAIMTEDRPKLASVWPEAPPALAGAIDRALLRDVSQRWQTMRELMAAVRAAAEALGIAG
ncbi:MAG: serine/threonine protein kinase [Sandaracinaceae bacterium]|nr:serine/threonine protein kinase [Sandaracinaceae bacterium]